MPVEFTTVCRWAIAGLALAGAAEPQPPPQKALSQQIRSRDWGVSQWSGIRRGQLRVVHGATGDELQASRLLTTPRAVYSGPRRSSAPGCDGNCLLVAAFDSGVTNRLGGHFSAFSRAPAAARVSLEKWDDGRRALTLDYDHAAGGYCGFWVHLFDFTLAGEDRIFFDSTPFSHLTFWIRGRRGGERILLKVADAQWEAREDALPVGELSPFLRGGAVERTWQRVTVPLAALPQRLDRRELATLVFEAAGATSGQIAIKDISFCKKAEPLPPLGPPRQGLPAKKRDRALWVWNTREILASPPQQQELAGVASRNGFTDLFLQLTGPVRGAASHGVIDLEGAEWRPFLALLTRSGLRAHALDGFSQYALPEWHAPVLRTVENVIRYNQSVPPAERFYGIHYDIEPYLIPGFSGPLRGTIVASYLDLLSQIAARASAAGLRFGADIPFWYDSRDEWTGELPVVDFRGARKLVSEHVIDLADNVAVMVYRTYAFGADGLLSLAQGELDYAAKAGKGVFVGLETTSLPDEDLVEFEGEPFRGMPQTVPAPRIAVLAPDGDAATLWLVEPAQWPWLREQWEARRQPLGALLWWPVGRVIHVPGDKLTFARAGLPALERTMAEAEEELSGSSSFAGFAIHDYIGYRALVERSHSTAH